MNLTGGHSKLTLGGWEKLPPPQNGNLIRSEFFSLIIYLFPPSFWCIICMYVFVCVTCLLYDLFLCLFGQNPLNTGMKSASRRQAGRAQLAAAAYRYYLVSLKRKRSARVQGHVVEWQAAYGQVYRSAGVPLNPGRETSRQPHPRSDRGGPSWHRPGPGSSAFRQRTTNRFIYQKGQPGPAHRVVVRPVYRAPAVCAGTGACGRSHTHR
jgi:hypothetical protein